MNTYPYLALFFGLLLSALPTIAGAAQRGPQSDAHWVLPHMQLHAEVLADPGPTPPADDDPRWQSIELPDVWRYAGRDSAIRNVWYRLHLPAKPAADGPWALYLFRLNMNASVWLNRSYIGDGGRFSEPIARNWNRPLLFVLPDAVWQPGTNIVHIRLMSYPLAGALAPPMVGPLARLTPLYEHRLLMQNTLSEALFYVTFSIGMIGLVLRLRLRRDGIYLWFALAALAWSTFSLHMFVRDIPIPTKIWWNGVHAGIDLWIVFLAGFAHRLAGVERRHLEKLLLAFALTGATIYFALPLADFIPFANKWHLGSLVIGGYVLVFSALQSWRRPRTELIVFTLGLALIVGLGIHDWQLQTSKDLSAWATDFHRLHFGAPLLFIVMAWHLSGRFIDALNETKALNRELEARVQHAVHQLDASYRHTRELENEQAAIEERERIYRDLHDDLGAKLLSLVYRAANPATADLARSALQDLRDVVSRPSRSELKLPDLFADWHAETRQRLDLAGIRLHWQQPHGLADQTAAAQLAFHLGRVLREAVTNILKHAQAAQVYVDIDLNADHLVLNVRDDGDGCHPGQRAGRGRRNMQRRVTTLGGEISWQAAEPHGCRVHVTVPYSAGPL